MKLRSNITRKIFDITVAVLEVVAVITFVPVFIASFVRSWHEGVGIFRGLGGGLTIVLVFGILFLTIDNYRTLKDIRDLLNKKQTKTKQERS